ncbi:MAG: 5-oxoprolinase subunit PxpB [Flavobacteriaceae bacterium]|nr:5-oxoprolinase subunit PxpB [Flavobacteriaceae bacterium]
MSSYKLTYKLFGDSSILVEWPLSISPEILSDIKGFNDEILHLQFIQETIPAYNSITIIYDSLIISSFDCIQYLQDIYKNKKARSNKPSTLWKVPVCYDLSYGKDMTYLADTKGLSVSEIIELHSSAVYDIHFIGFLPGFPYLGGLDERLHTERKQNPELHIKKGAVAIGGKQTGIYPADSPGGWHVIGHTPISLFDVNGIQPCLVEMGDKLQFYSISKVELQEHNYELLKETYHD